MVICPYCEQDDVWEVSIDQVWNKAFMCLECDTVWNESEPIMDGYGLVFRDVMSARGLSANWKAVRKIRKLE